MKYNWEKTVYWGMASFPVLLQASSVMAQDIGVTGDVKDDAIAKAAATILTLIQGAFGALVAICAGLGAILSSAFGQYRAALSCLIVAVGAFILQNFVEMFFNTETLAQFLTP